MAIPKKRVGGETISPDGAYPGTKVLKLMDISFANGKAAGIREVESHNEASPSVIASELNTKSDLSLTAPFRTHIRETQLTSSSE